MRELLESLWVQAGFAILFGLSGWVVAYAEFKVILFLSKQLLSELDRRQNSTENLEKALRQQTEAIEKLSQYKTLEDLIVSKLGDRR